MTARKPRRPHDSWADEYDTIYELLYGRVYRQFTDACTGLVERHAKPGSRVLDLGAGTGRLAIPLASRGHHVTTVELSSGMCRVMRRKARAAGVPLTIKNANVTGYTVRARQDLAFCFFNVLNYLTKVTELNAFARCCAGALRPGGVLVLSACEDLSDFESTLLNPWIGEDCSARVRVDRRISVEPAGGPFYRFAENTVVVRNGVQKEHREAFKLRSWPRAEVAKALGAAGFSHREDFPEMDRFGEAYASYVLARAPRSRAN